MTDLTTHRSRHPWGPYACKLFTDAAGSFASDPHIEAISRYSWREDEPLSVLFHAACYKLLRTCLASEVPAGLNHTVLYEALRPLFPDVDGVQLSLVDYGETNRWQPYLFQLDLKGPRSFATLPTLIPELAGYYHALPKPAAAASAPERQTVPDSAAAGDIFAAVATELVYLLLSHMDFFSLMNLRKASPSVASVPLTPSFWRRRIHTHMPWLYDFPFPAEADRSADIDWTRVHHDLHYRSERSFPEKIDGLVNRRRIWASCQMIAGLYLAKKDEEEANNRLDQPLDVLSGIFSRPLSRLVLPEAGSTQLADILLLARCSDITTVEPVLVAYWDFRGALACLEILQSGVETADSRQRYRIAGRRTAHRSEVRIPLNQWITGLVVTTQESPRESTGDVIIHTIVGLKLLFSEQSPVQLGQGAGNQRLLPVSPGKFLVGLATHYLLRKRKISKLGLLQQPLDKLPPETERIRDDHALSIRSPQLTNYLWRDAPPPPSLTTPALSISGGAGHRYDENFHVLPMEALVLGTTEAELADIVSIAGDAQLGGFEVRYGSPARPARAVGPRRHAMKVLPVDGAGGERVAHIFVRTEGAVASLRIATTRRRQLVLGRPQLSAEIRHPQGRWTDGSGFVHNGDEAVAGFYACWRDRALPQADLVGFGVLSLPRAELSDTRGVDDADFFKALADSDSFPWDPVAPPAGFGPVAPRVGLGPIPSTYAPRPRCAVSWVDCRAPLASITATLVHPVRAGALPPAGLEFRGARGAGDTVVGPSCFGDDPPHDADGVGGAPWCWCLAGEDRPADWEDPGGPYAAPHYRRETWDLGGRTLRCVRAWSDPACCITGLQFVASDGAESPLWGRGDGRATDVISFGGSGGDVGVGWGAVKGEEAVGLKFYTEAVDRGRGALRSDDVVVALQAWGALMEKDSPLSLDESSLGLSGADVSLTLSSRSR